MTAPAAALLLVLTTVGTRDDAERLARSMVGQRLAACVQIEAIDSVYRWDGQLQHEGELRLLLKTCAATYPALEAALRREHPYTLPAIVAVPCERAEPAFAAWVAQECGAAAPSSMAPPDARNGR